MLCHPSLTLPAQPDLQVTPLLTQATAVPYRPEPEVGPTSHVLSSASCEKYYLNIECSKKLFGHFIPLCHIDHFFCDPNGRNVCMGRLLSIPNGLGEKKLWATYKMPLYYLRYSCGTVSTRIYDNTIKKLKWKWNTSNYFDPVVTCVLLTWLFPEFQDHCRSHPQIYWNRDHLYPQIYFWFGSL